MLSFYSDAGNIRLDPEMLGEGVINKKSDGTLYVQPIQANYVTVTISVYPAGSGRTTPYSGGVTVSEGSMTTVEAFANEGYEFERWSDGGAQRHNVIWSAGASLIAYFKEITT